MRILLFTGKGGVGKTTTAAATALRLADRGTKTLLVSTDGAHSLADALGTAVGSEPGEVAAGLAAVQVDTQRRFENAWQDVRRYLLQLVAQGGADPITAEELTVLPGIDEVLSLLAVRDYAQRGRWDAIVVDCAPTAETLRLLALPEALNWYLQRVFPLHRALARGMRPLTSMLGRGGSLPPDAVFEALLRLSDELAEARDLLADPDATSVRLVLTPEKVVTAEARRTFTALALYGYQVDEVVANRVFPGGDGASGWQAAWVAAQRQQLEVVAESFAGLPVRQVGYRPAEPVGEAALREVATELYGEPAAHDPAAPSESGPLLTVSAEGDPADPLKQQYVMSMRLPLADRSDVEAARSGEDLVVTVAGHRRILTLPSVLRRCQVRSGRVADGRLVLRFAPDPRLWPGR